MTCNLLIMEGSVMALVVVGNPPRLEVDQTGDSVWGGNTDGGIHAQPAWPHAKHHNLVIIRVMLLIIAALDSPFQELQTHAII